VLNKPPALAGCARFAGGEGVVARTAAPSFLIKEMSKELTKFTKSMNLDNLKNFDFCTVTIIRKKQNFIDRQLTIIFPNDFFFIFDVRIGLI
jgi:hypothetical protein